MVILPPCAAVKRRVVLPRPGFSPLAPLGGEEIGLSPVFTILFHLGLNPHSLMFWRQCHRVEQQDSAATAHERCRRGICLGLSLNIAIFRGTTPCRALFWRLLPSLAGGSMSSAAGRILRRRNGLWWKRARPRTPQTARPNSQHPAMK
ncbi:hypothetical protein JL2886_01634 [Phaeobacter gallaeciensis]|uniref:Uncharacterized protein n=1 Tax=Phaeobacter gallaeciensis TaxID=60890 RepID=A0A1B0ZQT7_9RHOB|nr:hypothetical protein JL2886_01634 [Phaeobacter gallaeciensis]